MRHVTISVLLAALACSACAREAHIQSEPIVTNIPSPAEFTSAPLRNRIRVELNASVSDVWALVGEPGRMAEFSSGLERVEAQRDASGQLMGYTCTFKPMAPGEPSIVSSDRMRYWLPQTGWASSGVASDAFGLSNDLNAITLTATASGTMVTWEVYFDAGDVAMMKGHFNEALADIAANLTQRFGGRVVERYVEPER